MTATLSAGDGFASYRIVRLIGAGGMGTMYLAHDDDLDRPVALKLMSRGLADDADLKARFLREAKTAARLDHPNIVSVYARGVHEGQLYIAMQFIEGSDASWPIKAGHGMPVDRAVSIVSETAAALDFAHVRGILHRDVKPANILLAQSESGQLERVLLADFGIAKALEDTADQTHTGLVLASFQYAAPEQFDPQVTLDQRVDVYALGATFYHLLTGQQPFSGSTMAQLISGHLHQAPPRPSAHGLPMDFDRIIATALAKNREHRYPTCGALAADARDAFAALNRSGRPLPPSATPTAEGPSSRSDPTSAAPQGAYVAPTMMRPHHPANFAYTSPPQKNKKSAFAALAVVGTLAFTALLAWAVLSVGDSGEPDAEAVKTLSTSDTPRPATDLALDVTAPMTQPACDGSGIVVLGSAVTPGRYDAEVQQMLNAFPGAAYLRTDQVCSSLRPRTEAGNPIYAVYRYAGRVQSEVCSAVRAAGGGAYGKWLDKTTDPGYIIPC